MITLNYEEELKAEINLTDGYRTKKKLGNRNMYFLYPFNYLVACQIYLGAPEGGPDPVVKYVI